MQDYKPISRLFPTTTTTLLLLQHINPAKLKAIVRCDFMTYELVFQAKLILKIKQKQGKDEALKKPLCLQCEQSVLNCMNLYEINFSFFWGTKFHTQFVLNGFEISLSKTSV